MNWTAFWVLVALVVWSIVAKIVDAIRRVITEEDVYRSWKREAVFDIIEANLLILILVWMLYW